MSMPTTKPVILVVDDEPANIELLDFILQTKYSVIFATNGRKALEIARSQAPDLILLDIMMPEMDGYEVCTRIKQDPHTEMIPVIFVTAKRNREDILKGLQVGAYYYLAKPIDRAALLAVVATALHDHAIHKALQQRIDKTVSTFGLLESCRFRFRTLEEAHSLAVLISNACPEPEKRVVGLTELLINAVEHGNLGLTYEDKTRLQSQDAWFQEVERRLQSPECAVRSATIQFERDAEKIRFLIRDQGRGFDWRGYLQFDPARAFDSHGRGIAMANLLSFDHIQYLGSGNEVMAELYL